MIRLIELAVLFAIGAGGATLIFELMKPRGHGQGKPRKPSLPIKP